jgi:addiction module RelE/StbE family toxin
MNLTKKDKKATEKILKGIKDIEQDPHKNKELQGMFKGSKVKRKGDYRIIYKIYEDLNVICILKIGHRNKIYNKH